MVQLTTTRKRPPSDPVNFFKRYLIDLVLHIQTRKIDSVSRYYVDKLVSSSIYAKQILNEKWLWKRRLLIFLHLPWHSKFYNHAVHKLFINFGKWTDSTEGKTTSVCMLKLQSFKLHWIWIRILVAPWHRCLASYNWAWCQRFQVFFPKSHARHLPCQSHARNACEGCEFIRCSFTVSFC